MVGKNPVLEFYTKKYLEARVFDSVQYMLGDLRPVLQNVPQLVGVLDPHTLGTAAHAAVGWGLWNGALLGVGAGGKTATSDFCGASKKR